jgi:hypothetical protein
MTRSTLLLLLACAAAGLGTIQDASAIITRHDVTDDEYVVDDSDYPALVDLFWPGDCIGTLITNNTLLTVAHCAEDLRDSDSLIVNGTPHNIDTIMLHPDWDGWNNDIALVRFENEVNDVTPYAIYKGIDEEGEMLTLVGRGVHATGLEGEPGATTDGLLRRATNRVSSTTNQWLEVYFEDPDGTDALTDLEGVGAAGDSGSPAFLDTDDGFVIAGLNSWGDAPRGVQIGQYGAFDFSTRVSQFADWIEKHTGETGDGGSDPGDDGDDTGDDGDDTGDSGGDDDDGNDDDVDGDDVDNDDDVDGDDVDGAPDCGSRWSCATATGSCATAPGSTAGWLPLVICLGLVRRRASSL